MAATTMPDAFAAGTTVVFTASYGDFPANAGWTATLYLAGASVLTPIVGVASGTAFTFTITAAAGANLVAGNYSWQVIAVNATLGTFIADYGVVEVTPNITTATAGSLLTWAQRTLPLVEAALAGQVTENVASYQIGNRSLVKLSIDELLKLRAYCETVIAQEKNPGTFLQSGDFTFTEKS
jgi:hypothetical protein